MTASRTRTGDATEKVLEEVHRERVRQVAKGWTPKHDDEHTTEEIVALAIRRTRRDTTRREPGAHSSKSSQRRNLIEAAAMLVAGVEAMDRRAG